MSDYLDQKADQWEPYATVGVPIVLASQVPAATIDGYQAGRSWYKVFKGNPSSVGGAVRNTVESALDIMPLAAIKGVSKQLTSFFLPKPLRSSNYHFQPKRNMLKKATISIQTIPNSIDIITNNNLRNKILHRKKGGEIYQIDNNMPQITQRYISLLNQGIPSQVAFDTAHLSLIEDGRKNKFYSFGKRATNLQDWTKNATNSLTTGRYKNLLDTTNFDQFKKGLKLKNYNIRPAFYNIEMNRGRSKNKQIINQWNQQNDISPVAGVFTINKNLV